MFKESAWKAMITVTLLGLSVSCASQEKRASGPVAGESYGQDPKSEVYAPASSDLTEKEKSEADAHRLHPSCALEGEPPAFPPNSDGVAFRAWVRFTISASGRAEGLCYARVEGLHEFEEKAMADRGQWDFDKKYAGEPRERLVTYRKTPPKEDAAAAAPAGE